MTQTALAFEDDDNEQLMRQIAREEIARYVSEKMAAAMKLVVAVFAKSALGSLAKGQQTSNSNAFADLLKAKLEERLTDVTPDDLEALIRSTVTSVLVAHDFGVASAPAKVIIERSTSGDYVTSVALMLGKKVGVAPRDIAAWIAKGLNESGQIASAEVTGPGFITIKAQQKQNASTPTEYASPEEAYTKLEERKAQQDPKLGTRRFV